MGLELCSNLGDVLTRDCLLPDDRCILLHPADKGLLPSNEFRSPLAVITVEPLADRSRERSLSNLVSCTSDFMPLIRCLLFPDPNEVEEYEGLDEEELDVLVL